jgi:SP family arabinose:H+ symporter-like MFS transporter
LPWHSDLFQLGVQFYRSPHFLTIVEKLGAPFAFFLYAAIGVGGWFFCRFCVPETKGRTLEEIEEYWYKGQTVGE